MLAFIYLLLKIFLMVCGFAFVLIGFVAVIRSFTVTNHVHQADRLRRALLVGGGVALLAPGVTLLAYGFSSQVITFKTIFMVILTSACFSPIGLIAIVILYYRLWGLAKLREDALYLSDKLSKRS